MTTLFMKNLMQIANGFSVCNNYMSFTVTDVSSILPDGPHACMAILCRMISAILWHLLSTYVLDYFCRGSVSRTG